MPKLRLSDSATLDAYRRALHPPEQKLFDQIVFSLKQPSDELEWYHHLGGLFGQLQLSLKTRSAGNLAGLAEAFGPSESLFSKSRRLVDEYPSQQSLSELQSVGTDWTRFTLVWRIRDKKQRLDLLREAVAEEWSIPELREQLEKQFPSKRKGVGGPNRKPRLALPPVGRIRELARLSKEWNHILSDLPSKSRAAAWKKYASDLSIKELKELVESLKGVLRSLKEGLDALKSVSAESR